MAGLIARESCATLWLGGPFLLTLPDQVAANTNEAQAQARTQAQRRTPDTQIDRANAAHGKPGDATASSCCAGNPKSARRVEQQPRTKCNQSAQSASSAGAALNGEASNARQGSTRGGSLANNAKLVFACDPTPGPIHLGVSKRLFKPSFSATPDFLRASIHTLEPKTRSLPPAAPLKRRVPPTDPLLLLTFERRCRCRYRHRSRHPRPKSPKYWPQPAHKRHETVYPLVVPARNQGVHGISMTVQQGRPMCSRLQTQMRCLYPKAGSQQRRMHYLRSDLRWLNHPY